MLSDAERAAMRERHWIANGICAVCHVGQCEVNRLLDALDEALDTVEDLVSQHCYQEQDGSYDTSALSTNRAAFDLLVRAGRAEYVGEQVGRRAFIRFTEATDA